MFMFSSVRNVDMIDIAYSVRCLVYRNIHLYVLYFFSIPEVIYTLLGQIVSTKTVVYTDNVMYVRDGEGVVLPTFITEHCMTFLDDIISVFKEVYYTIMGDTRLTVQFIFSENKYPILKVLLINIKYLSKSKNTGDVVHCVLGCKPLLPCPIDLPTFESIFLTYDSADEAVDKLKRIPNIPMSVVGKHEDYSECSNGARMLYLLEDSLDGLF